LEEELGRTVEKLVSGIPESYRHIIKDIIFEKLGMKASENQPMIPNDE
jgi:hypothetical protein